MYQTSVLYVRSGFVETTRIYLLAPKFLRWRDNLNSVNTPINVTNIRKIKE